MGAMASAVAIGALGTGSAVADYAPDETFGAGGFADVAFAISEVHVLEDGRILVGGTTNGPGDDDFVLARLTPTGEPDVSFGEGDGRVITDVSGEGRDDDVRGMAVQPDGSVLLAGSTATGDAGADLDTAVVRYADDGSLDEEFDGEAAGNGVVVVPTAIEQRDFANDVAVDAGGRIVLAGRVNVVLPEHPDWSGPVETADFSVIRLTPSGALDDTFDDDGLATVDFGEVYLDEARTVTLLDDGDILAGGFAWCMQCVAMNDAVLARLDGTDGTLEDKIWLDDGEVEDLITEPGTVVAVGNGDGFGFCGFRLDRIHQADGTYDPTLAGDGSLCLPWDEHGLLFHSVAVDGSSYVVGGRYLPPESSVRQLAVGRFLATGAPDTSFGPDGVVRLPGGEPTQAVDVDVYDDGDAATEDPVVAGISRGDGGALLRLAHRPDPLPETTFITPKPGPTHRRRPVLRFAANVDATFRCRVDSKPWMQNCRSGRRLPRLAQGRHRIRVQATDYLGNVEQLPARRHIRVVAR